MPAFESFRQLLMARGRCCAHSGVTASISSVTHELPIRSQSFSSAKSQHNKHSATATATATVTLTAMHNPDYVPANTSVLSGIVGHSHVPTPPLPYHEVHVHFSAQQAPPKQRKLGDLFAQKIAAKEFFYGIELTARSYGEQPMLLDYDKFGVMLPLFTSLVWLGPDYSGVGQLEDVEAIQLSHKLHPHAVVLPHFTCYRLNRSRLTEFLNLNFTNVLALRGDQVSDEQDYKYASELVAAIREIRGDTISIGVAAYPEGHPAAKTMEEDMEFLLQKVHAGADFVITQICFSSQAIVQFARKLRSKGMDLPIIVGVLVPDNMRVLERILEIAQVRLPAEEYSKYKELEAEHKQFQDYSVRKAVQFISEILDSDVGIYGVQFYTMNRLKTVQRVLTEITEKTQHGNKIET